MKSQPSTFWPTVWLALSLVLAKAVHWSLPDLTARRLYEYAIDLGVSAHQDVLFAVALGLLAQLALRTTAPVPRVQRLVWLGFLAFGALCVLYAVASVQIFAFLRSPLTYALLYVAGDMKNMRSSIGSFVTPGIAGGLLVGPVLFLLVSRWSVNRERPPATPRRRAIRAAGAILLLGYLVSARQAAAGRWQDRDDHLIVKNPHWELLSSTARELAGHEGVRIDEPYPPEYLADFEPAPQPPRPPSLPRPRNLLPYVLESTGAKYPSLYGGPYAPTPRLPPESAQGLVFAAFHPPIGVN